MLSKKIFDNLVDFGFCPRKSNVMEFPKVPIKFLADYIRGYFDGDGFVSYGEYPRKNRKTIGKFLLSGFVSGSGRYIIKLKQLLEKHAGVQGGFAYYRQGYRLAYSINDSMRLYNFMYKNDLTQFCLKRKKEVFEKALTRIGPVA